MTCEKQPLVVFNSYRWDKPGVDWIGLYSFNLNTKELTVCVSPETLRFSEPHGRMWIIELILLSEDARTLYVTLGIDTAVPGSVGGFHFYVARVDLGNQQLEVVSPLNGVRF